MGAEAGVAAGGAFGVGNGCGVAPVEAHAADQTVSEITIA
jgi:hypothetical protein